jgi:hypothetical protein
MIEIKLKLGEIGKIRLKSPKITILELLLQFHQELYTSGYNPTAHISMTLVVP